MVSQGNLYDLKDRSYYQAVKYGVLSSTENKCFGCTLDIGGGDGASSQHCIDQGWSSKVYILDPFSELKSKENIQVVSESADDLSIYGKFQQDGIQFDSIFCFDVLEHLVNPWAVLKAVSKCQTSGGRLLVSMPNARFVALTVPLLFFGRFDYKQSGIMDRTHLRWFTRATTIELIEDAGYTIDNISAIIEPRVKFANVLTLGFFSSFF